jgi:uncharacterized glyoxalase superfamily protein PhnB
MKQKLEKVTASIEVGVDPEAAFRIFTEEINAWWVRGPINFYDGARAAEIQFEPGVGGRFLEVYDAVAGDALEVGRITVWEPGRRLVYRSSLDDTEVDIKFEATSGGTRLMLEQRLVPGGVTAHFLSGWENVLGWFADRADWPGPTAPEQRDLPRISPVLYYKDVKAAVEWLIRAFGLRSRHRGRMSDFGELALGDSVIILWSLEGAGSEKPGCVTHSVYCYVDDLEGHFARAKGGGAVIIDQIKGHGDRVYVAEDLEGHRWTFAQARPTQR